MPDDLWNAAQAAAYLNLKRPTIYDWAAKGVLPCVRLRHGRRRDCVRFRKEDLDRIIQARTVSVPEK